MRTSASGLVSTLLAVTLLPGCGAALAMLKGPIVDKCKDSHLEGCDGMAEGAITYLGGDHAEGRRQIAAGAARNAPKDVAIFAVSLRTVASLPGAGDYKADLEEIAGSLQGTPSVAAIASPTRSHRDLDRSDSAVTTTSAAPGAAHLRAGTASFRGAKACTTMLGASSCARGVQGPATVTMLFTPGGCPADLTPTTRRRSKTASRPRPILPSPAIEPAGSPSSCRATVGPGPHHWTLDRTTSTTAVARRTTCRRQSRSIVAHHSAASRTASMAPTCSEHPE